MWSLTTRLKTQNRTIKVHRNGYTFQVDPDNPTVRYFGGGGSSVKTVDPWSGTGIRELFNQFTDYISPNVGAISAYPGQIAPGASNLQQTGFDVAQGLTPIASGGQQYFGDIFGQMDTGAPSRAMGTAESALAETLAPFDKDMAMQAVEPAKELALDTYFRDIVPQLKESYVSRAGTADAGALNRALAREGSRLSMGLNAQLAPYLYSGSEAQKNRQQTGVNQAMNLAQLPGNVMGQAGQIAGLGTDTLSSMLNMGAMQRGIEGEQLGEEYSKWASTQPYNNPYADLIAKLSGSAPQMDYVSQGQGAGLGSQLLPGLGAFLGAGGLSSLFGGAAAPATLAASEPMLAAGPLAMMLSDVRLKENFRTIEDALKKLKQLEGKTYNYKSTPERRDGGVIAQDLEKVLPEGVIEHHGIKFVKLDAIMALLVNAVNEVDDKIETLRTELVG